MSKYEYIESQKHDPQNVHPVVKMCRWLAVSTSGFYHWIQRPQSATAARRQALTGRIRHFFEASDGTYGYRRIHADLVEAGTECSPELVRQVMRHESLVACQPRPFRVTTETDADAAKDMPDLVKRDFTLDYVPQPEDMPGTQTDAGFYFNPESRAVRDLYVSLQEEFGSVAAVVDLHHMGPCNETTGGPRDGKQVTVAIDYPPLGVNDGAAYLDDYPLLDQDKSRRYALAAIDGLTDSYGAQSPLAGVVRYLHPEEREFAGQGRSAFALNGSASVLFEVRGQTQSFGQKQKGMLVKTVETGLMSIIKAMADGSVNTLDGDDFFDYPDYGWDTASGD